jgi:hypothetical protein
MDCVLISPQYRQQNKELHKDDPAYGFSGRKYAARVYALCERIGTLDVLDYGCGKRTLEKALGFSIKNYDPCIDGCDAPPGAADVVACVDVLEHIEPECLDAVLDDLRRVTRKLAILTIANRPAKKTLPDGRNAHLIQEGPAWWLPKICARFHLEEFHEFTNDGEPVGFAVVVRNQELKR